MRRLFLNDIRRDYIFTIVIILFPFLVHGQTYVTYPIQAPVVPGDYYHNQSITLSPGFSAAPTGNDKFHFYINQGGTPAYCVPLTTSFSQDKNYIVTTVTKVPGITNAAQLAGKSTCEVMQTVQYTDGLGRTLQNIVVKGSPGLNDIVQVDDYDVNNRQPFRYLPYTAAGNGAYKVDALQNNTGVSGFYNNPPNGIIQNSYPFSQSTYDASPLNRVVEQCAPGNTWQLENGHTAKNEFGHNYSLVFNPNYNVSCKRVALYTATSNTNGTNTLNRTNGNAIYDNDQLYVDIRKNENWVNGCLNTTETYIDKDGKTVLTRTYNQTGSGQIEMLSTYNVYDQFGNLCYILPPKAEPDNDNAITQDVLDNLCYQYRYDTYNRVIEKKVPGKGWDFMVYNSLSQMVLSQNANQRNKTPQQWTFAKYDALARNIITGIYNDPNTVGTNTISNPNNSRRIALQATLDQQQSQWEVKDNTGVQGYSNVTFPQQQDIAYYLSVNYYDSYDIPGLPVLYDQHNAFSQLIDGSPTASKTAVLNNPSQMLWTVKYYDDNHNLTKVFVQHYKGNVVIDGNYDAITANYSFNGEVLNTIRTHNVTGVEMAKVYNMYEYDQVGRKLSTWERINNGTLVLLSSNQYNELGQLVVKKLHSEDNGGNFLQSVNYSYNERGWMTDASSSLFNMELRYDNPAQSTPQYNGNISEVYWGSSLQKTFNYEYDNLNRLTQGVSQTEGMSENGITYDKAGNIRSLTRDANVISYNYLSTTVEGNQLSAVGGTGLQSQNYVYDSNGNVTTDGSKTNIQLSYNLLNLTETVSGSQNITYTYDASGAMLSKNSSATGLTEYIGGIQYGSNTGNYGIDFIQTEEGRAVRQTDNSYRYQYDLSDHLGNTRLTFDKDPTTNTARRIQEDDYYPFGMRRSVSPVSLNNEYLFTNKELQPELGEYDYGARLYDPITARWNAVDALAGSYANMSPYNFTLNNPVNYIDPNGMDAESKLGWILPKIGNIFWDPKANSQQYLDDNHIDGKYLGMEGTGIGNLQTGDWYQYNSDGKSHIINIGLQEISIVGPHHGVGQPSLAESIVPVWGPGRAMVDDIQNGHFWKATFNGGMLLADVFTLGEASIERGAVKLAAEEAEKLVAKESAEVATKEGTHLVYQGIDPVTEEVKYVGITSRQAGERIIEHQASRTVRSGLLYREIEGASGLTRNQARTIEQNLINTYGLEKNGGQLFNKINSIAEKRWSSFGVTVIP